MSPSTSAPPTRRSAAVPGAGGIVFDREGRVLVLGHADGAWVFPKGHIEQGETSQQAALREVAEEAGVAAVLMPDTPTWTTRYRNSRGVPRAITWYACTTEAADVHLTERLFQRGGFYAPVDALALLTHQSDREVLASVIETVGVGALGDR